MALRGNTRPPLHTVKGPGCAIILALLVAGTPAVCYQRNHRPDQYYIDKAVQDSLRLVTFKECNKRLPQLKLKVDELISLGPGRYVVLRSDVHNKWNISCNTWQNKFEHVDTSFWVPGNGRNLIKEEKHKPFMLPGGVSDEDQANEDERDEEDDQ